jgi:hypothetical protein
VKELHAKIGQLAIERFLQSAQAHGQVERKEMINQGITPCAPLPS